MRKKANELKKGDKVNIAGKVGTIEEFELSDIGKQGKRKCRIKIKFENGEEAIIIRPEDYPFNCL